MMLKIVLLRTVIGPVTPAMHSGWAPNTEKMKEAINDDSRTSDTPYCWVVSIKSREKAMPGRTLRGDALVSVPADAHTIGKTHLAKNINTIAGITL